MAESTLATCFPTAIKHLADTYGWSHKKIGDEIGCSDSYISKAIRQNEVRKTYDMAARLIVSKLDKERCIGPEKPVHMIVSVPNSDAGHLIRMVEQVFQGSAKRLILD